MLPRSVAKSNASVVSRTPAVPRGMYERRGMERVFRRWRRRHRDEEAFLRVLALVLWRLFPEADAHEAEGLLKTWLEDREMEPLASIRIKEYGDECREEGIRLGIEQGIEQGIERGVERGIERGVEQGLEQGLERGLEAQRALLRGQASVKFGAATAHGLSALLATVSESESLARVGGWMIECATGEELLDRVRDLANGTQR